MAEPIQILTEELQFETQVIPCQITATNSLQVSGYYFRTLGSLVDPRIIVTTYNIENNFRCGLNRIEGVRITAGPHCNQYPCVVFGKTPNPKIGESGNIHWFPDVNVTMGQQYAGFQTLARSFTGHSSEIRLNSEYKFFRVYLYDTAGAYNDADGFAFFMPGHSLIDPAVPGLINNGPYITAVLFLQFFGR